MENKIKLLDNKYYDKAELLKRMLDDEFYYGELNRLALSSSSLKTLLSSPKTYKFSLEYGSPSSQALRDGWLFHTAILEPNVFEAQTFIDVQSKNTKKFREAKAENPRVFTAKEKSDAERLADAFLRNEHAKELIRDSEFEVPVIGEVMDMPFRGKADVLGANRIVDLKTTTDIKGFSYSANKYGYDVQCYLYCNLFKKEFKDFHFLVLDKGSLDIGIFNCSEEFYYRGEEKVEKALDLYNKFFIEGADLDNYCLTGEL
ncbi:PD-(D/E)XK nuclease-like domain-containing protein [bacterium]|nr:PD-(D/E)XK nuclease-like domain-containing protein [bacterium]